MLELSGQLLCCLPNGHILENIDGGSLTDLGALAEPIRTEDGWFTPPDRPGHGIVFDRAVLAAPRGRFLSASLAKTAFHEPIRASHDREPLALELSTLKSACLFLTLIN